MAKKEYKVTISLSSSFPVEGEQAMIFQLSGDQDEERAREEIWQYVMSRISVNTEPLDLKTAIELEKGGN